MGERRCGQGCSDQLRERKVGSRRREGGGIEEEAVEGWKAFSCTTQTRLCVGIEPRVVGEMGTLDVRPVGGEDTSVVFSFVEAGGPGRYPHGFQQVQSRPLRSGNCRAPGTHPQTFVHPSLVFLVSRQSVPGWIREYHRRPQVEYSASDAKEIQLARLNALLPHTPALTPPPIYSVL